MSDVRRLDKSENQLDEHSTQDSTDFVRHEKVSIFALLLKF